jgi:hypothetical protein
MNHPVLTAILAAIILLLVVAFVRVNLWPNKPTGKGVTVHLRWSTEEAQFWIPEPLTKSSSYVVRKGGVIEDVHAVWEGETIIGWCEAKTVAPGDVLTVELNGLMRPIVSVNKGFSDPK